MRVLRSTATIAAPRERVFALLEDPRRADDLHPAFLRVAVLRSPWIPKAGERTLLRLALRGQAYDMETEIGDYRRGYFLLERQVAGPFASFEHAVSLESESAAGGGEETRLTEVLAYTVRLGPLGRLFDVVVLRRELEGVLRSRRERLREMLERTG